MADIQKGELQDNLGNTIYPQTSSDIVFCTDGKSVEEKLEESSAKEKSLDNELKQMKTSFTDGCNAIVAACTTYGVTPASNSPTDIVNAIKAIYTNRYNEGVTYADSRTNVNSANYKAGYNAGITYADSRTNTSSANYKAGYNAGITYADGRVNTNSASYKSGYNAGDKTHSVESKIYYTNGGGGSVYVSPCLYVDGKLKVTGTQQNIYNMNDGNYYGSASATV